MATKAAGSTVRAELPRMLLTCMLLLLAAVAFAPSLGDTDAGTSRILTGYGGRIGTTSGLSFDGVSPGGRQLSNCDDGNLCTDDSYDPVNGCVNAPVLGRPCDETDPCTTACAPAGYGRLTGSEVVPPVTTEATGAVTVHVNPSHTQFTVTLAYQGLDPVDVRGGWIRLGLPGENGPALFLLPAGPFFPNPIIVPLTADSLYVSHAHGIDDMDDAAAAIQSGRTYAVIETLQHLDGEIRAQVVPGTGAGCVAGPPCHDGNPCTDDSCDGAGGCINTPVPGRPCNDHNACFGGDTCDSAGQCYGGFPLCYTDGNPCTQDSCDPATGCVFTPYPPGGPCSDGNACTTGDQCAEGGYCSGQPVDCDDHNACTEDSCNWQSGCRNTPLAGTACDDGNPCTSGDTCGSGTCHPGAPSNTPCDDGNPCTLNDACAAGTCQGGPPPSCDDGSICTDDNCQAPSGCVHVDNGNCSLNPKTQGYWKRICAGPHPSADAISTADVDCVSASCTFEPVTSTAELCERLNPSPPSDTCEQAEAQFMALLLNFCRARVQEDQPIDSACSSNGTAGASKVDADSLLCDLGRSHDACVLAKCESEEINSGRAMWTNSLRVHRLPTGAIELTWNPPYTTPDWGAPSRYRVWGRTDSDYPFVLLGETETLIYTDSSSTGSTFYEYELSAVP